MSKTRRTPSSRLGGRWIDIRVEIFSWARKLWHLEPIPPARRSVRVESARRAAPLDLSHPSARLAGGQMVALTLRRQFLQNEPDVAANQAELVVDAVKALVEHLVTCMKSYKLSVNSNKPGIHCLEASSTDLEAPILGCESRMNLRKPACTSANRRSISSACSRKCSSRFLPAIERSRSATRSSSDLSVMPRNTARSMPGRR